MRRNTSHRSAAQKNRDQLTNSVSEPLAWLIMTSIRTNSLLKTDENEQTGLSV